MVALRVGLGAQLGHGLAIHLDPPRSNQFFCLAPRGNAGGGNNLLQALRVAFTSLLVACHGSPVTPGEVN